MVLIVDDDRESRETLADLVRLLIPGAETLVAGNGQVGVELALRHRPKAVVLDIEMPVLDGVQAATRIRAAFGLASPTLIGVSGNVPRLEEGRDAGVFDHILPKPILIAELVQLLS